MLALKQLIENIQKFLLACLGILFSVPKILLMSSFIPKNPNTKMDRASILGNGPSLNESLKNQLEFINSTEIYCVNNFASYPIFEELKPENYILLDPAYFTYSPTNNAHKIVEKTIYSFEKTVWPMNIFLPTAAKKSFLVQTLRQIPSIKIYYFNYTIVESFDWWDHLLFNAGMAMPQCQNILAAALFLGIKRKHKEVYLFGGDHSWHEDLVLENNEVVMKDAHFYSQNQHSRPLTSLPNTVNKMYKFFNSLAKAFYCYERLQKFAHFNKVKVFNASTKSYLDTFQKIQLTSSN